MAPTTDVHTVELNKSYNEDVNNEKVDACEKYGSRTIHGEKWNVVSKRHFNAEECATIKSVIVVDSKYGKSACFFIVTGGMMFIPLSNDCTRTVGEVLDMEKIELVTLERNGSTLDRIDAWFHLIQTQKAT